MATNLPMDLVFTPLSDHKARPLEQWLTTFHLASVVLDPYTNESSWVLNSAIRILDDFRASDVRVNFIVTADKEDANRFLGPLAERFLTFVDPDRKIVAAMELQTLPAFVFVQTDGLVRASAEGWAPTQWHQVAEQIASVVSWKTPDIPVAGDPGPFSGSPALG